MYDVRVKHATEIKSNSYSNNEFDISFFLWRYRIFQISIFHVFYVVTIYIDDKFIIRDHQI